jgi:hypothetical protein
MKAIIVIVLFSAFALAGYVFFLMKRRRQSSISEEQSVGMTSLIEEKHTDIDAVKRFFMDAGFPSILLNDDGKAIWMNTEYKRLNKVLNVFDCIVKTAIAIEKNGSKICFVSQKPYVLNKTTYLDQASSEKITAISLLPTVADFDFSSAIITSISDSITETNTGEELNNLLIESLKNVNYLLQVSSIVINFESSKEELTTNISPDKFVAQFTLFFKSLVALLDEQNLNHINIKVSEAGARGLVDIVIPGMKVSSFQNADSANAGRLMSMMTEFEAMLSAYYFKANFRIHGNDLAIQLSFNALARHEIYNSDI